MTEIDFAHDTPEIAANKLFNAVQRRRVDVAIMRRNGKPCHIDNDLVQAARSLARELTELAEKCKQEKTGGATLPAFPLPTGRK